MQVGSGGIVFSSLARGTGGVNVELEAYVCFYHSHFQYWLFLLRSTGFILRRIASARGVFDIPVLAFDVAWDVPCSESEFRKEDPEADGL